MDQLMVETFNNFKELAKTDPAGYRFAYVISKSQDENLMRQVFIVLDDEEDAYKYFSGFDETCFIFIERMSKFETVIIKKFFEKKNFPKHIIAMVEKKLKNKRVDCFY